jgi:hypothetical protein
MARYRQPMSPRWLSGRSTGNGSPDPSTWPEWLREAYVDRGRRLLYRAGLARAADVPDVRRLNEQEWAVLNAHPIRRNDGELDALCRGALAQRKRGGLGDDMRADAVTDTVAWLRGDLPKGPATGRVPIGTRPMLIEVAAEAAEADLSQPEDLDDLAEVTRFERNHTVLTTIEWLIKATVKAPISIPPVKLHEPVWLPDESTWSPRFVDQVARFAQGRQPADAWTMLTHPIVRTTDEINHVVDNLRQHGAADALDVIAWARGDRTEAPWTGRSPTGDRPTRVEIDAEIQEIAAVADSAEASTANRERAWSAGGALAWLVGNLDEEP